MRNSQWRDQFPPSHHLLHARHSGNPTVCLGAPCVLVLRLQMRKQGVHQQYPIIDRRQSISFPTICWQEGEAPKQPEQEPAATSQPLDTWTLPENTGRAYAALDGDISPMHLYKATAMLMGFPSPVANVHFLAARTEATIDTAVGEQGMPQCLRCDSLVWSRRKLGTAAILAQD